MSDLLNQQQNTKDAFFTPRNEAMLDRLLYQDFQRRLGGDLSEKQKERLVKTVRHYMGEVYENIGEQPVSALNKEVLAATVPDFLSYLRRQGGSTPGPEESDRLRTDVGTRYGQLQTERQEPKVSPPTPPNFRINMDDTAGSALALFEEVRKQRDTEAARVEAATAAITSTADPLAARSRNTMLSLPPETRSLYFPGSSGPGAGTGLAQANPTLALPDTIRTRAALPQDQIIKQDDVISYRENEFNLFLYSSDRDWVSNSVENRYNFSVNFDPANNRPGFSYSTAANIKFKNIVRIELVKVIVPTEGVDILAKKTGNGVYNTDININALSFPFLMLRIPELDTNNFGTNNNIDNSFGVIQYDANWISDNTALNRGYLAMIPKFMKCQKVFYPTPLATLQKLTVQINRPDGNTISPSLDTLDVSGCLLSSQIGNWPGGSVDTAGTYYVDTSGSYIWVQTKTWFSKFLMSQADRIVFKNLVFPPGFTLNGASSDFLAFMQRSTGHLVIDVGRFDPVNGYKTGGNIQGYCNYVIIRNNFGDPTTGSETIPYWGGSSTLNTGFLSDLVGTAFSSGRFINLNHQTQVVLRVITRDMDSASRLRPDNSI